MKSNPKQKEYVKNKLGDISKSARHGSDLGMILKGYDEFGRGGHLAVAMDTLSDEKHLFTSESVTEGHPDKMADQISDAILDAILRCDPEARVACETFLTTGMALVGGEITTTCYVDIPKIIRDTIKEI